MIKVEMISAMNSMKNIIIYLRKVTSLFFKRFLNLAIHDFVVYDFSFKNIEVWSYVSADGKTVYFGGEFCVYRALEGTAFYSGKMKVEAVAHADGTFEKPTWEQTGTYLEPPF